MIKRDAKVKKTTDGSAVDVLVQQIKSYIQENQLGLGDSLPSERELGEMYDSARNTVREAIRILKAYGVVDVRPKVGAVIVNRHMDAVLDLFSFQLTISSETFKDIQGFRRLIEVGSVDQLFSRVTDTDLGELRRINSAILHAKSAEEAGKLDFEFHSTLLRIAGNETVLSIYNTMMPIITRLMETGKHTDGLEKTYEQHSRILDALHRRDRLAFQYQVSEHMDQGLRYIDGASGEK